MATAPFTDRVVRTPEGRELGVCEWGDPQGLPVLLLHGTPGSRMLRHVDPAGLADVYRQARLHTVTYDRPGYGVSTRRPGRAVVDAIADVWAIADALGLEHFGVAGASTGGPCAAAVAARLRPRVTRCVLLQAPAPFLARDLDFFDGMAPSARAAYDFASLAGPELEQWLQRDYEEVLGYVEDVLPTLDLPDAAVEMYQQAFTEAFRWGPGGMRDDAFAAVRPWGFEADEVHVPTRVAQAEDDDTVPRGHAEWWLRHLPDAELVLLPGGHFGAEPSQARARLDLELDLLTWAAE